MTLERALAALLDRDEQGSRRRLLALEETERTPCEIFEQARLWCELQDLPALARLLATVEGCPQRHGPAVACELRALAAELGGDGPAALRQHRRAAEQAEEWWYPQVRMALLHLYGGVTWNPEAAARFAARAGELAPQEQEVRLVVGMLGLRDKEPGAVQALQDLADHGGTRPAVRRLAQATLEGWG